MIKEILSSQYNEDGTIDCQVIHEQYGEMPITVSKDDAETAAIFEQVKGTAAAYVPPSDEVLAEQALVELRIQRDEMLVELDRPMWLASLTAEQKAIIDEYYQALLDAPEVGELPAKPEFIK